MNTNEHLTAEMSGSPVPGAITKRSPDLIGDVHASEAQSPKKTFTQEELNRILSDRLTREKTKSDSVMRQREQELMRREGLLTAREKALKLGLPEEILDVLDLSNPQNLDKGLGVIQKYMGKEPATPTQSTGLGFGRTKPPGQHNNDLRAAMGLSKRS